MDEKALGGVANPWTLGLRVVENRKRHREVGLVVDVDVAHALVVLENRNERGLAHRADEPFAAARNRDVDETHGADELGDRGVVGRLDKLHGVANASIADGGGKGLVRLYRLLAAAQDHGIAGLQAKRSRVDEDVRARLEDNRDHAERHAHLADLYPARALARPDRLSYGIGQGRDMPDAGNHRPEPRGRERQAVEHRGRDARLLRMRQVDPVRGDD